MKRYREMLKRALQRSPFRRRAPVYRIGKYVAVYDELTDEETQMQPPGVEDLFKNSTPVNRAAPCCGRPDDSSPARG